MYDFYENEERPKVRETPTSLAMIRAPCEASKGSWNLSVERLVTLASSSYFLAKQDSFTDSMSSATFLFILELISLEKHKNIYSLSVCFSENWALDAKSKFRLAHKKLHSNVFVPSLPDITAELKHETWALEFFRSVKNQSQKLERFNSKKSEIKKVTVYYLLSAMFKRGYLEYSS